MNRKTLLFIVLSFLSTFAVYGQVTEFGIGADSYPIIRSLPSKANLILTKGTSGNDVFILHTDNQPVAQSFELYPGVKVHDVRIWNNEYAYFCGTYEPLDWGIVGRFNIADVFNGTGNISFGAFDWVDSGFIKASDLKRLELYKLGTTAGMAMVGDAVFDSLHPEPTTTVASAYFDGANWQLCTYMRKPDTVRFTDIACLDNIIVAVGSDTSGAGCFVKTFFSAANFPLYPCMPGEFVRILYGNPVGDVLVKKTLRDTAVIAHLDNTLGTRTVFHKVPVDQITGIPTITALTWVTATAPSVISNQRVWELATLGNTAYLLQNAPLPSAPPTTNHCWIAHCSLTPAPTTTLYAHNPTYDRACSMDLDVDIAKPRIACQSPYLLTYGTQWNASTGNCSVFTTTLLERVYPGKRKHKMPEFASTRSSIIPYIPFIEPIPATIICSE